MNGNRIIVHALIEKDGKYLVTKRSDEESTFAGYWDIPGGLVEIGELPKNAVIRETKEEVNLTINPMNVIHEDSNLDTVKDLIFIRLVYVSKLIDDIENIKLDELEHSEYKFISSLDELNDEDICPFLIEVFKSQNIWKRTKKYIL